MLSRRPRRAPGETSARPPPAARGRLLLAGLPGCIPACSAPRDPDSCPAPALPRPQPVLQPRPPRSSLGDREDRVARRRRARSRSAWGRRRWRPDCLLLGPAELSSASGVQVSSGAWGDSGRSGGSRGECPWRGERWLRRRETPCELRCIWVAAET